MFSEQIPPSRGPALLLFRFRRSARPVFGIPLRRYKLFRCPYAYTQAPVPVSYRTEHSAEHFPVQSAPKPGKTSSPQYPRHRKRLRKAALLAADNSGRGGTPLQTAAGTLILPEPARNGFLLTILYNKEKEIYRNIVWPKSKPAMRSENNLSLPLTLSHVALPPFETIRRFPNTRSASRRIISAQVFCISLRK